MTNHLTVLTNKQCRQTNNVDNNCGFFFLMLELYIIYPMLRHYKNTDIIIILFCDLT